MNSQSQASTQENSPNYSITNGPSKMNTIGEMFVQENKGDFKDFYKISSSIGQGSYGEVRKCLHRESRALRAVKIVFKKKLEEQDKIKLLSELSILKTIDHPNILKLYEFFEDHKRFFLVTELCTGGELFDKIAEEQSFYEANAAKIIKQILSATNYCHQHYIVHRDLKPENILLNNDSEDPKITLIDFGQALRFDPKKKMTLKSGTSYYIAPEVLNGSYDEMCDLWSIGVILFIMLVGYPPFNGGTDEEISNRIIKGNFSIQEEEWKGISKEAKDLVSKLLCYNPKERITAKEALHHPWVIELTKNEVDERLTRKTLINLRNFNGNTKIKQAVLAFIATHLTKDNEKKDLDKIFKAIDSNGDGHLTKQEILSGYEEHFGIPISEEQVDEIFEKIDLDRSGTIDYTEFVMATINEKNLLTEERLKMAFQMFDKDKNGSLSPEELQDFLCDDSTLTKEYVNQVIQLVDVNGDGEIQFDEFCFMMKNMTSSLF